MCLLTRKKENIPLFWQSQSAFEKITHEVCYRGHPERVKRTTRLDPAKCRKMKNVLRSTKQKCVYALYLCVLQTQAHIYSHTKIRPTGTGTGTGMGHENSHNNTIRRIAFEFEWNWNCHVIFNANNKETQQKKKIGRTWDKGRQTNIALIILKYHKPIETTTIE